MDRKSEIALTAIMIGFFAVFMFRLPDAPITKLKTNTDIFSTYIATNMVPNADGTNAPVYADVNALTGIAPAAGDTTPAATTPSTDTPSTNTPAATGTVAPAVDEKADDAKTDASVKQPAAIAPEDTKTDDKAAKKAAPVVETPTEKPAQ